ncbi:MAG: LamG-like jellyroll fold domain-containing protein, partial [Acidimicrobiales bacterium]
MGRCLSGYWQRGDPLTNDLIARAIFADPSADTHKTLIGYHPDGRVASVKAPIASTAMSEAQRPQHTFAYSAPGVAPATAAVRVEGTAAGIYARTVTLDAAGHASKEVDAAGIAVDYTWDQINDRIIKTIDHHHQANPTGGLVTTHLYDAAGRLTDVYGPGAPSEFGADNRSTAAPRQQTFYDEAINGLAASWWNTQGLVGTPKAYTTTGLDQDWAAGSPNASIPADGFSGRLTGEVTVPTTGEYTFSANVDGDDGVRLSIDDASVIDRWNPYKETVLADGPVAYWRLGEASGTTAADSSGNGRTGSYLGGVTLSTPGAIATDAGTAATFNGTSGYVDVANNPALQLTGPFTLEAWMKTPTPSANMGIVEKYDDASKGYVLRVEAGQLVAYTLAGASSYTRAAGATTLQPNVWYHVAAVYDGTRVAVFVNGALDGSAASTVNPLSSSLSLKVGAVGSTPFWPFNGVIDEAAVYNKALADSRIGAHHQAGVAKLTGDTATLTEGANRIRVDYNERVGNARLKISWGPKAGTLAQLATTSLKPRYGLVTSTIDADSKKESTEYANPELGLATAVVADPAGANLRTTTVYEAAGSGFFRRKTWTLPAGNATTYSYYGEGANPSIATNPCPGGATGVHQG